MFEKKTIILVTGSDGQLGREFRKHAAHQSTYEFLFTNRSTLDLTKHEEIDHIFKKFRPDFCINCAAYTAVDKAEEEIELSDQLNRESIIYLVDACENHNCKLITFSTDYVYDSITDRPLTEIDPCSPKSQYGKSKRAGEELLENSSIQWINLRVSWLYSTFQNNFVKTMIRLGSGRDELKVVNDQIGSPTYTRDLLEVVIKFIESDDPNHFSEHYNFSNLGETTWADFARKIFSIADIHCTVEGITTEEFGASAPRPKWSVLSKEKIISTLNITIKEWEVALEECIKTLNSE